MLQGSGKVKEPLFHQPLLLALDEACKLQRQLHHVFALGHFVLGSVFKYVRTRVCICLMHVFFRQEYQIYAWCRADQELHAVVNSTKYTLNLERIVDHH